MIRIYDTFEKTNKLELFDRVNKVLTKRQRLWDRYSRGINMETSSNSHSAVEVKAGMTEEGAVATINAKIQILFEKFIVDIAAGYLSGEISYDVNMASDIEAKVSRQIFGREPVDAEYAEAIRFIIRTIAADNRDQIELTTLFKHALLYGSCYERISEDNDHKYRYVNLDALNTVAIWNNDVEPKLVAVVSQFKVRRNMVDYWYYRVYLKDRIEVYYKATKTKSDDKDALKYDENESKTHSWGRVPVVCYESDFSIIDNCEDLIVSYEALLNNVRNTYQYNDTDCKMKIVGYRPQNPITIPNPKKGEPGQPDMVLNPARQLEDDYVLAGKTFYVQEGGDADWLTKPIQANDVTSMLKYYVDSIFQMCGIPNTADLAFNSSDLNASAIDRKFYVMNIALAGIREGVTRLIRDRLKMFLDRINLKNSTNYSVDNITISIHTNLPSMTDENIDQMMQLNGILSEQTIITKLGYDYETEKVRKESEINDGVAKTTTGTNKTDEENVEEEEGDSSGAEGGDTNDGGTNPEVQPDTRKEVQTDDKRKQTK